jgi:hypothetical protein
VLTTKAEGFIMRLLYKCGEEFKLKEYPGPDFPRYAILSHTWGSDTEEVTFQDLVNVIGFALLLVEWRL